MASVDDFRAAGLYDPAADAETGRLELLDWLAAHGFTVAEMRRAEDTDALAAMAGDRRLVPGERFDRATAIRRSGLTADAFDAYSTAFGLVPIEGAPDGEIGYTADEIDAFAVVDALAAMFSPDEAVGLIRVIGSALGRIGEAAVSLFLADVESEHVSRGDSELALARSVFDAVGLLDGLTARLDPILRRLTLQAIERTRRTAIDEAERFQYRYAVGFVDLVGFTALSAGMAARDLSAFIGRFEGQAHDAATRSGARVVKLIGDEVMFVATDPVAACVAAVELMSAFAGRYVGVAPRGGLAFGNVVLRGGDYYGTVVNLAARLVDEAVPLEVLVTRSVVEAAPTCDFDTAGRRMVKGFDDPVAVWSIRADQSVARL